MNANVQRIADEVRALVDHDREEFLAWLADFELQQADAWDKEIEADSQPGGRLSRLLLRARQDITQGRTKPLVELPVDERLRLVEIIWESIASEPHAVPVGEAHRAVLDARLADHMAHPDDVISRSEAMKEARGH